MNRVGILFASYSLKTVNRVTDHVEHTSFNLATHGHGDGGAGRFHFQTARKAVRIVHGHCANHIITDVLLHFDHECAAVGVLYFQGIVDVRENFLGGAPVEREMNIDHRTDDLRNITNLLAHSRLKTRLF